MTNQTLTFKIIFMNDLTQYFKNFGNVLITSAICCAATVFLFALFAFIKFIIGKKYDKRIALAEKILQDAESENAVFVIEKVDALYRAVLKTDKTVICETKDYSTVSGAKSALKSLKNNIDQGNFAVLLNGDGSFSVKIYSSLNTLFVSPPYESETEARKAIDIIVKAASSAVIE